MSKSVKRLYAQFVPENYNLEININPDDMSFTGKVSIKGKKTGRPSQRLTLHQKDLKVESAVVTKHEKSDKKQIKVSRINTHKAYDELRLHAKEMLYPGIYTIDIGFSGKITKSMVGLYPCYFEHGGKTKIIFATQFESHHAREVFPCIDEPEAKATFDLTLFTPANQEVLSNTQPIKQELKKGQLRTTFEQTPLMSTYLLAFACGELHKVEGKTKSGITLRSWASTAQPKANLQFSLDEGIKVLEFYEEYFGTPFPLKKLDQIALPDFDSGAMENWGLVTYREIAMLTDPANRSIPSEQYVALVIAHELSHQWFGNLVTMKWWDDLWLNESFASLAEHICLDSLHPDWHQWENYTSADVITSSNRDIYSNVQPVGVTVTHPDEIITLFDPAIVYAKGGRLLKMMREYIGEEAFRAALKEYFKTHAYKNTAREDLWKSMSKASGKDIEALMTPWLVQSGMPVVKVEKSDKPNKRKLTQSRFVLDVDDDTQTWPIPLLSNAEINPALLTKAAGELEFQGKNLPIINKNGSGHFVTHYSNGKDLELIINEIKSGEIPSEARINILNDLMLLARRGDNSLVDTLKLIKELQDEPRDAVWALMTRGIGLANGLGEYNKVIEPAIKTFRYELAKKKYESLGWDDSEEEDLNTVTLRATILGVMLGSEHQDVIDESLKRYSNYKEMEDIPADRRSHLLGAAVRHDGSDKIINRLIDKYKASSDPDLQLSISSALCFTKSETVAERLCDEAMGEEGFVRDQDLFRWYAYLMRNKYTREVAWEWLVSSWDRIAEESGGAKSLEYYVWYTAGPLHTNDWKKRFDEMFEPKKKQIVLKRNIEIAQTEIDARIKWRNRELPLLESYFKSLR